jgi:hypothetical protein
MVKAIVIGKNTFQESLRLRSYQIILVFALLLLGSVALAQSGGQPVLSGYTVERGTATGGGYRLMSLVHIWQVGEVASGGGYRLLSPASPGGGNQCCCTYLPCVVRNFH